MLCDRSTENFGNCQINFLTNVISPYFTTLSYIIPGVHEKNKKISENIEEYKKLVDHYEKVRE